MIEKSFLSGVVSAIRSYLGDANEQVCDLSLDGKPQPSSEGAFYGVVPGDLRNDANASLDGTLSFSVVVTLWADYAPEDRIADVVLFGDETAGVPNSGGISQRCDRLIQLLHLRYTAGNAANVVLASGGWDVRFVEPPVFQSRSRPEAAGADWLSAEADGNPIPAVRATVSFGGVRFIERIDG